MKKLVMLMVLVICFGCNVSLKKGAQDHFIGYWQSKRLTHVNGRESFREVIQIYANSGNYFLKGNGYEIVVYYKEEDGVFYNENNSVSYMISSNDSLLRVVEGSEIVGIYQRIN